MSVGVGDTAVHHPYLIGVSAPEVPAIRASVAAAVRDHARVVLAVSGGLDSSVLLDAAAATAASDKLTVATFDHGTGAAATIAVNSVAERCAALGIACVSGRASAVLRSEAALRGARWSFLRGVACATNSVVCTAHTADDQIETVLMRLMRDAGARGLAALAARSSVVRPLLANTRAQLEVYARSAGVRWVDDPSNASRAYLRNRVRHDLLPALRRARPGIDAELLAVGERAAAWRAEVEDFVAERLRVRVYERSGWLDVPARALAEFGEDELRVLWPAIAAMAGVTLDRRAIERVVAFTPVSRVGARVQVAGRLEVVRSRDTFQLRPGTSADSPATLATVPLSNTTTWGDWVFRGGAERDADNDANWSAWLPADQLLSVRAWRAGDRLARSGSRRERKVKELLTNAGVTGHLRAGWPVVLAGDQIVWVPGVGCTEAATARPGRPGLPFFCEYISR